MMLEEELAKRKVLRHAGCYSVNPKSKSIIESLDYTNELLNDKQNLVVIFAQGKIESYAKQFINFEKGANRLIKSNAEKSTLLFCVISIEYYSNRKPTLFLEYREYSPEQGIPELIFNEYYRSSRDKL
jgi:hypothetical protein